MEKRSRTGYGVICRPHRDKCTRNCCTLTRNCGREVWQRRARGGGGGGKKRNKADARGKWRLRFRDQCNLISLHCSIIFSYYLTFRSISTGESMIREADVTYRLFRQSADSSSPSMIRVGKDPTSIAIFVFCAHRRIRCRKVSLLFPLSFELVSRKMVQFLTESSLGCLTWRR